MDYEISKLISELDNEILFMYVVAIMNNYPILKAIENIMFCHGVPVSDTEAFKLIIEDQITTAIISMLMIKRGPVKVYFNDKEALTLNENDLHCLCNNVSKHSLEILEKLISKVLKNDSQHGEKTTIKMILSKFVEDDHVKGECCYEPFCKKVLLRPGTSMYSLTEKNRKRFTDLMEEIRITLRKRKNTI